jgi:hypothetical protein
MKLSKSTKIWIDYHKTHWKKKRCEPKLNELAIFAMDANARIATFDVCDPAHGLPQVVAALFVDYSAPTTALELWRISSQMGR